jgi:hypothetical protein
MNCGNKDNQNVVCLTFVSDCFICPPPPLVLQLKCNGHPLKPVLSVSLHGSFWLWFLSPRARGLTNAQHFAAAAAAAAASRCCAQTISKNTRRLLVELGLRVDHPAILQAALMAAALLGA